MIAEGDSGGGGGCVIRGNDSGGFYLNQKDLNVFFLCVSETPLSVLSTIPFLYVLCVSPFSVVNKSLRFALCTG